MAISPKSRQLFWNTFCCTGSVLTEIVAVVYLLASHMAPIWFKVVLSLLLVAGPLMTALFLLKKSILPKAVTYIVMAVANLGLLYAIIPVVIFFKDLFKGAWYTVVFNAIAWPLGIIVMFVSVNYICIYFLKSKR